MKDFFAGLLRQLPVGFVLGLIADPFFDALEDVVQDSENKWDDRVALPIIAGFRALIKGEDFQLAAAQKRAELDAAAGN